MYMYVYAVQHMICGVNSVVMASMTAKTILGRIYDYNDNDNEMTMTMTMTMTMK